MLISENCFFFLNIFCEFAFNNFFIRGENHWNYFQKKKILKNIPISFLRFYDLL